MYERLISKKIQESLEESPVVLVNGARQTGKSTLVQTLLQDTHTYYTLDDTSVLNAVCQDPTTFLSIQGKSVVLDEVQRAPELFIPLKHIVDQRRKPGHFVLTGSANVLNLPRLSESLAGRMEIHTLWPLAQAELHHAKRSFIDHVFAGTLPRQLVAFSHDELVKDVLAGGYPDVLRRVTESKRDSWCAAYLQTLLQRDVRDLMHIERLDGIPKLLRLLATRVANVMNTSELSRSSGLPNTTLKRYLTLLETLYLYVAVPSWSGSLSKRLTKAPKVYLNDTRLLCHLLGVNQAHLLSKRPVFGHILENFVVMELKKQQTWADVRTHMFYYRTHSGEEIDIVLEALGGKKVAIEVKATQVVSDRDFKHIRAFQKALPNEEISGFVAYMGQKIIPWAKNLTAIPIPMLWSN